jgi:hypothetical protein
MLFLAEELEARHLFQVQKKLVDNVKFWTI